MLSPLPLNAPPKDAVLLSRVSITTCDTSDMLTSQDPRMMICEGFSKVIYF